MVVNFSRKHRAVSTEVYCQVLLNSSWRTAMGGCLDDPGYLNAFRHFSFQVSSLLCCPPETSNYRTLRWANTWIPWASLSLPPPFFFHAAVKCQSSIFFLCTYCVFSPQLIDSLLGLPQAHLLWDAHTSIRNDDYKDGLIARNTFKKLSTKLYKHMMTVLWDCS